MSIRRVVPDITSEQIDERRKFYTEFLGFDVAMDMGWIVTLASPFQSSRLVAAVAELGSLDVGAPE